MTAMPTDRARRTRRGLLWALLISVIVLYAPFGYLVLTSFKTPGEAIAVPPSILPGTWSVENYEQALNTRGVRPAFLNSVSAAVLSTGLSLLLAVPAAYGVTRFGTVSGRVFVMAALVTRMVPPVALGVPLVDMMGDLALTDTPTGLALAHTTISSRSPSG